MRGYNPDVRRLAHIPTKCLAAACALAWALGGCNTAAPPPAPPPTAVVGENAIRTDGIYECRGIETRVSTGGWRYLHLPPTTGRTAYFLRFFPDGQVHFMEAGELTTAEAVRLMADYGNTGSLNGEPSTVNGGAVHIVFPRPFPVYADGTLRDGQLILQWNAAPGPNDPSVFQFVKWP